MKAIQVVPYIDEEASGPSYSTRMLTRTMNTHGIDARLAVTADAQVAPGVGDPQIVPFRRWSSMRRLGVSPEMLHWLRTQIAAGSIDIVHNHSLWMMPNVYCGRVTRGSGVPLVVSPRGTFSRWALNRSKTVKFLFWHSLQKRAIAHAALFHATAESEAEDIRRLGFRQPIAVIPNGIEIPALLPDNRARSRTLLFLGRLHPVKGVDLLLQAWARLHAQFPDWNLRIAGPGNADYLAELMAQAKRSGLRQVEFAGPLYGLEKTKAYQSASLFVLPTHSENFGMSIAEALASGCPVVTTKGAPWSGLVTQRAGWWIEIDSESLRNALAEAMSRPAAQLAEMGARGRAWMERDFSWDEVGQKMIDSYRWIGSGGNAPEWIRNV